MSQESTSKIELTDFMNFLIRFNQGRFPHERLGQAFINHMLPPDLNVVDSEIFYETDQKVCTNKIMKKYVDLGE